MHVHLHGFSVRKTELAELFEGIEAPRQAPERIMREVEVLHIAGAAHGQIQSYELVVGQIQARQPGEQKYLRSSRCSH